MNVRRLLIAGSAVALGVLLPAHPASAHPLGNFTINQYVGVTVAPDHVDAKAIVDTAEIPTLQERPDVDANGDGVTTGPERAAYATRTCAEYAAAVVATADGHRLMWTIQTADLTYHAGAGGLDTSRLACSLHAAATLTGTGELTIANGYLADRIGWREITATGAGLRLVDPSVPAQSISRELTAYPPDLLTTTLDVRSARIGYAPGSGTTGAPVAAPANRGDPLTRLLSTMDYRFADLAGGTHLTPLVAVLAVGLALLLGAGHAALPGHGKTILAAYLAGKRGRPRDAWLVAGTVTLTHTGGVLALGLLISAGVGVAGERILAWLGLISGLVVLGVGATMLAGLLRRRAHARQHRRGHEHHHDHDHEHPHHAHHRNDHASRRSRWGLAGIGIAGGLVPSPSALVVLLAAIGLGRAGFGILLVLVYGAGMALMLAGAGLALLAVQRRMERRPRTATSRLSTVVRWVSAATPAATAALIVLVGAGLALRAAVAIG
jgi:ABC-type nickel/cobalt efflux system permease component RcnA